MAMSDGSEQGWGLPLQAAEDHASLSSCPLFAQSMATPYS